MEIKIIETNKKDYLDLLLLADEQESMIDKYLQRGTLFALYDGDLKSVCVVTDEGDSGFVFSYRIENYILEHYDEPIYEAGIQLKDKVYLERNLICEKVIPVAVETEANE